MTARWLRSGQNKEVKTMVTVIPPVAVGPRICWLHLSKLLSFFPTKTTELYHMVTAVIIFIFCLYDLTSLGFKPALFQCVIKSLGILQTEDSRVSELM